MWAVPFGIVGARLYHVITSPEAYFGAGGRPDPGALHLGGRPRHLGGGRRRRARRLARLPAAAAAVRGRRRGRGRACRWPRRWAGSATGSTTSCTAARPPAVGPAGVGDDRRPGGPSTDGRRRPGPLNPRGSYHPTFLYERCGTSAWRCWSGCSAGSSSSAGAGRSRSTSWATPPGRFWIELMRHRRGATSIFGLRINVWVSLLVFLAAAGLLLLRVAGRQEYLLPADGEDRAGATGRSSRRHGRTPAPGRRPAEPPRPTPRTRPAGAGPAATPTAGASPGATPARHLVPPREPRD